VFKGRIFPGSASSAEDEAAGGAQDAQRRSAQAPSARRSRTSPLPSIAARHAIPGILPIAAFSRAPSSKADEVGDLVASSNATTGAPGPKALRAVASPSTSL